jgi:adenylate cyclase
VSGAEDPAERSGAAERAARAAETLRRANQRPGLVRALRTARELLPGDENFGDQLSTAEDRPSAVIARFLSERQAPRGDDGARGVGSASSEAGLAALQVWQSLSQKVGRGAGVVEATILFTDLVGFSSWVLEAGDEAALNLLRAVASVVEPAIDKHQGRLVKRLGDGHMAVFASAESGVRAALSIQDGLTDVEVAGHRPRLRAGLHCGQPRKLGGDYLGTDVNIAARVGEAAGADEVLISDAVLAAISAERMGIDVKRRRGFRAKGVPRELDVYLVRR